MKVALVFPRSEDNTPNNSPPLGIGYLSSILEKNNHETKIFDFSLYNWEPKKQIEELIKFNPDMIGMSLLAVNTNEGLKLANKIKSKINCDIIFGGPQATIDSEKCLKYGDYVVLGEGEYPLLNLVNGEKTKEINGLRIKNQKYFKPPELIKNLDEIPFPDRKKFDLNKYDFATIMTTRGCPFRCIYCHKGTFGYKYRKRSYQNVLKEIDYLMNEFGYDRFYFVDDTFTLDKKRILKLCEKLKNRKIKFKCVTRADMVDEDIIRSLSEAGCYRIEYGIETGNSEMIKKIKGITKQQVKKAIDLSKKYGIETKGFFMLGLPGDTEKTMNETIEFASKLELDRADFSITTPFPGTRLYEMVKKEDKNFNFDPKGGAYYSGEVFYNMSKVSDETLKKLHEKSQYPRFKAFLRSKNLEFLSPFFKSRIIRETGKKIYSRFLLRLIG